MFKAVNLEIINAENEKIKNNLKFDYEYLQKKIREKKYKY